LKDGSSISFDGIAAHAILTDERGVRLSGAGRSGRRWQADLCCLNEVWRGDLDGNGVPDYVFFSGGPYGNGRTAPLFSLSILSMDADRMPAPFFTTVYKGENGDGIRHLVDLSNDGRAEILISSYDEGESDDRVGAFCSGHWVNQLYRFNDLGVEEMSGTFSGITFPMIHNWSYRGTECLETPRPFGSLQPPDVRDHGSSAQREAATIIRAGPDAVGALGIEPVGGCKTIRAAVVVYDRSQVREIAFPNPFGPYSQRLEERIRRDAARVGLRGINHEPTSGECSVNLMWAR